MKFYGRLSGQPGEDLAEAVVFQLERLGPGRLHGPESRDLFQGDGPAAGTGAGLAPPARTAPVGRADHGDWDPQGRKLVADIIQEEQANGTTVFLSSHILSDIERTCDRLIMIRNGEVVLKQEIGARFHQDGWEIEVLGWGAGADADLARSGYRPRPGGRRGSLVRMLSR